MTIISKPLNIGAGDLLRGVEHSYCDPIDVLRESLSRKTWKHRYGIISQGCVYIYKNRNAKKPKQSFSLSLFAGVEECEPESGEDFCFCLRYKKAQTPILFSCDTMERKSKWINQLCSEITNVQSYNLSADSAYGSAGMVPGYIPKLCDGYYDEVDEERFKKEASTSQTYDENSEYEIQSPAGRQNSNDRKTVLMQQPKNTGQSDTKVDAFTKELKMTIDKKQHDQKKLTTDDSSLVDRSRNQSRQTETSFCSLDFMSVRSCESESFLDVRNGDSGVGIEESQTPIVNEIAELYVNMNDSDGSSDSGNTSPKTVYENPEELQSAEQHKFEKTEYFYDGKRGRAKRLLKQEEVGAFIVYLGEATTFEICVKTPHGLKYFRLYEQNGRVSLFRSQHQITFGSVDELLGHYKTNDLPADDYKVKLLRGYNSNK